jgi:diguanylate cyclase (GGDEF)-like protein
MRISSLTGLLNRNALYQAFIKRMRARKLNDYTAILFFDLDAFKTINDTLGHEIGDQLLIAFSLQLHKLLHDKDVAARLGGDEFVVMICDQDKQQLSTSLDKFYRFFHEPLSIQNHLIELAFSVGVTLDNSNYWSISSALKEADLALYSAKDHGKNHYQFYIDSREFKSIEKNKSKELAQALENNELVLFYQPIVDGKTKEIASVEALIRWQHPTKGLLSPNAIIPIAESSDLILDIGAWVIKQAAIQIQQWQNTETRLVPIAVNLSTLQLKQPDFADKIIQLLAGMNIPANLLELEITESILLANTKTVFDNLLKINQCGMKLSLDDFGTGFSGFEYLKKLTFSKIKISQEFIMNMISNTTDRAITSSIIHLAHGLNMQVVSEGVETEEQYNFLKDHHVDLIQGYFVHRPMDAASISKLLKKPLTD